jgi:hypothetical protein
MEEEIEEVIPEWIEKLAERPRLHRKRLVRTLNCYLDPNHRRRRLLGH